MKRNLGSLSSHRAYIGRPPKNGSRVPFKLAPSRVFAAQVSALVKRLKAIGCSDVVLGVSGGLDSTLALLVCRAAFDRLGLDPRKIHAITMPGFATSPRTRTNAVKICEGLGTNFETIPIGRAVRSHLKDIGHDGVTADITYENAQARMRTLVLMNKANMTGGIVIGTGDMSEIALGWCTYNGDHMSMFSVNSGVPKTVVKKVCAWWASRNSGEVAEAVADVVATPVSPELVKGQVTENVIGPYELHDFFLWNFITNEMGPRRLAQEAEKFFGEKYSRATIDATLGIFMRRFFTQAFKRNCAPDGVKVFDFELSLRGWWIPSDLGVVKLHG
jgi:NAD+ synthase (glutamine-hydrolysing)